ncbi:unnamed protein product [Leptosia nina]|uniref:Uncharacterized protein n=1 Tax=Leptosia nina TaxID=320188 RepID=A0AAV1JUQ0_9NEOP
MKRKGKLATDEVASFNRLPFVGAAQVRRKTANLDEVLYHEESRVSERSGGMMYRLWAYPGSAPDIYRN